MSVKSAPYFWLECDAPGCGVSSTEGSDYAAWQSLDGAIEEAQDSEWKITDDHRYYCPDHANNVCETCGTYDDTKYSGERDYLCVPCAEKEGIRQCPSCGLGAMPGEEMGHDHGCAAVRP